MDLDPDLIDAPARFGIFADDSTFSQPAFPMLFDQGARVAVDPLAATVKFSGQLARLASGDGAVTDLVALLLRRAPREHLETFIDRLLLRKVTAESIYLDVLQPAARRLGEHWLDDTCTFVDVTLATALLHGGMRALGPQFHRQARTLRPTRSVLLTTLGRDQHTFGAAMAAEFFRRAGWAVLPPPADDEDVAGRLRDARNVVVGFSASRADQIPELAATVRRVRRLGRDRVAGILVGGPLFATHPELLRETGADALGLDARQAVAEAETLAAAGDDG